MKKAILLALTSVFLMSCSHYGKHPHSVEQAKTIGTLKDLKRYGPLTFAAQPDKKTINSLKDQGYELVINLRHPSEFKDFDEEKVVTSNDLSYYNIPLFTKNKKFSRKAIKDIHNIVKENHNKKIFIHCSSGNRAAAWLGAHLYLDHGVDLEESISTAKQVGMTKSKLETRLRKFLE